MPASSNVHSVRERGATMVEMAMVAPIFFMLLFGFIDIARYWQAKAALSHTAQEAADMLVVDPQLKNGDPAAVKKTTNEFALKRAGELVLLKNANIESELYIPPKVSDYSSIPVEVTLYADFNPLLPIVFRNTIKITSKVAAFIEPLKTTSEPIPTDCFGRLFDAPELSGSAPGAYGVGCPCEKGSLSYGVLDPANPDSTRCSCSGEGTPHVVGGTTPQAGSLCGCPTGSTPILGFDWSFMGPGEGWSPEAIAAANASSTICCPEGTSQACPQNQVREANPGASSYSCSCSCGAEAQVDDAGVCSCDNSDQAYTINPDTKQASCRCKLTEADCPAPSVLQDDQDDCECKCPSPMVYNREQKKCECKAGADRSCTDSGGSFDSASCLCTCSGKKQLNTRVGICECTRSDRLKCENSGGVFDSSTCGCSCPASAGVSQNGECACPNGVKSGHICSCGEPDFKVWDGDSCECALARVEACAESGGTINPATCGCLCRNEKKSPVDGRCACIPEYQTYCTKYADFGFQPGTYDRRDCSCSCPAGSSLWFGVVCRCDGGAEFTGGACNCPAGRSWNAGHTECVCADTAESRACVDSGGTVDPFTCQCSGCANGKQLNGSSCVCPEPTKVMSGEQCVCSETTDAATRCELSGGRLDAACNCSACTGGKVVIEGVCSCPVGMTWNPGTSSCECLATEGYGKACKDSGGDIRPGACDCICPGLSSPDSGGTCQCPASAKSSCESTGGEYFSNASECRCECGNALVTGDTCSCPNGGTLVDGRCDCGDLKDWDGASCACKLDTPAALGCLNGESRGEINRETCGCTCPNTGEIFSDNACKCPEGKALVDGVCSCSETAAEQCASGNGTLSDSCECECPGTAEWVDGACSCGADNQQFVAGEGCVCLDKYKGFDRIPTATGCQYETACLPPSVLIGDRCAASRCERCEAAEITNEGSCGECDPEW